MNLYVSVCTYTYTYIHIHVHEWQVTAAKCAAGVDGGAMHISGGSTVDIAGLSTFEYVRKCCLLVYYYSYGACMYVCMYACMCVCIYKYTGV
jgi:hypothetical protein